MLSLAKPRNLFFFVAAITLAACANRSADFESGLGINFPLIPFPIHLKGTPAVLIQLKNGDDNKLAAVNHDHFFPNNCWRVLVSEEAFKAGYFQDNGHEVDSVPSLSPDKHWTSQLRWAKQDGEDIECLEIRSPDTLRTLWPIGNFRSGVWAPDSSAIALAERREFGRPTAIIYWPADGEMKDLTYTSNSELADFFDRCDFRPISRAEYSVRRWISNTLVIVWYRSDPSAEGATPWGYEVLFDVSRDRYGSRVLRAYVGY